MLINTTGYPQAQLTSIGILGIQSWHLATLLCTQRESLQPPTLSSHTTSPIVQALLELIAFPAKDVITVLAVPGVVACTENEWLRSVGRPVGFVIECGRVPDNL